MEFTGQSFNKDKFVIVILDLFFDSLNKSVNDFLDLLFMFRCHGIYVWR